MVAGILVGIVKLGLLISGIYSLIMGKYKISTEVYLFGTWARLCGLASISIPLIHIFSGIVIALVLTLLGFDSCQYLADNPWAPITFDIIILGVPFIILRMFAKFIYNNQ